MEPVRKRPTLQDPEGRFAHFIEPVAISHGCRLVYVRVGGSQAGSGNALEIFLERLDGEPLGMDVCAAVSREVSAILDVEDPMGGAYRLEVGSPGLDRPLTDIVDFIRFKGCEIKVEFKRPLSDGQKRMRGTITEARPDGFSLLDDQKRNFDVELRDLASARLIATDDLVKAVQKGQFPKPINMNNNPVSKQMEA